MGCHQSNVGKTGDDVNKGTVPRRDGQVTVVGKVMQNTAGLDY